MKSILNKYNNKCSDVVILTITFLFFLQSVTFLVESIYALDLLNLELDEKALGVLFLFTPLILVAFRKKVPKLIPYAIILVIAIFQLITPLVDTATKIITAGVVVGCFMFIFPLYFSLISPRNSTGIGPIFSASFGISILLLILFKSLNATLDISTYNVFQVITWILAVIMAISVISKMFFDQKEREPSQSNGNSSDVLEDAKITEKNLSRALYIIAPALICIIALFYFAFSSPTVISRWTEGSYLLISLGISIMIGISIGTLLMKPDIILKIPYWLFVAWNLVFVLCLFLSIIVHAIPFPPFPDSDPVIVIHPPNIATYIPLVFTILLLPILFLDFALLTREIHKFSDKTPKLGLSFGLGSLIFTLLIFILIFTNIWGYVEPVSNLFRNLFWLPFIIAGIVVLLAILVIPRKMEIKIEPFLKEIRSKLAITCVLVLLVLGITISVFVLEPKPITNGTESVSTIRVMTYNIQQGVNVTGQKNYDSQLSLIKAVDPDILGLEESDTARISGGNSDVVRYFANTLTGLNYYSFYGPKTVTGTYGAAILSKYPIISAVTIFSYSDVDEIGTTEVQIKIDNKVFTVFVNHPAGSDEAKLAHIEAVMDRAEGKYNLISMGDFNSREGSIFYNMSIASLKDVWRDKWSDGVDDQGLNMTRRIDHIFVSPEFTVLDARFIVEEQSDHPALWTDIEWS